MDTLLNSKSSQDERCIDDGTLCTKGEGMVGSLSITTIIVKNSFLQLYPYRILYPSDEAASVLRTIVFSIHMLF